MSEMTDSEQEVSTDGPDSFTATYCESCGQVLDASDTIVENVDEPVHRVNLIEAVGEFAEVSETTAREEHDCEDCGGQVVQRYYVYPASDIPETDYDPPDSAITGRDPDDDAMVAMSTDPGPEDFQELREMSWLDAGEKDE